MRFGFFEDFRRGFAEGVIHIVVEFLHDDAMLVNQLGQIFTVIGVVFRVRQIVGLAGAGFDDHLIAFRQAAPP